MAYTHGKNMSVILDIYMYKSSMLKAARTFNRFFMLKTVERCSLQIVFFKHEDKAATTLADESS